MGLEQMKHRSVVIWPGCLEQRCGSSATTGAAASGVTSGFWSRKRGPAGRWDAEPSSTRMGVFAAMGAAAVVDWASSKRIRLLTVSEMSTEQEGQMNCTGFSAMSGVISKAYLAPHEHWIFISG